MLAPDREEQRKRDKKVSTKKHRNTLRGFLVLSNFTSCLGNLALFCTTTSRAVTPYQSKVQRHQNCLPTSSHHFLFKKQDKYLASSLVGYCLALFVRGFPRFLPFRKAERRLLLKEAHLAASQRGEAAKNEGLKALQAQLSEVLFELDRRAAKLLLKRLGSRFIGSGSIDVLWCSVCLFFMFTLTHIFRHMIFME